ncbi:unnamed protein product, partial [Porites evermanni]
WKTARPSPIPKTDHRQNEKVYRPVSCRLLQKAFERYQIMTSCWNLEPSKRPTFQDLVTSLEQELEKRGASTHT